MNKRLSKLLTTVIVAAILLGAMLTVTSRVKGATPPPAPSFYAVPDTLIFQTDVTPVGTLFNVTAWGSVVLGTSAWNMKMGFDATMLQCLGANYTAGATSEFFSGHQTVPGILPVIDNSLGTVYWSEALSGLTDSVGPATGSLFYATFNITSAPTAGTNLTCHIDPGFGVPNDDTFFLDVDLNEEPGLTTAYATYTYTSTPTITVVSVTQTPATNVQPNEDVNIAANVTGGIGGAEEVILSYNTSSQATFTNSTMSFNSTTMLWEGDIPGQALGTKVYYTIYANDTVGISNSYQIQSYYVPEFVYPLLMVFALLALSSAALLTRRKIVRR